MAADLTDDRPYCGFLLPADLSLDRANSTIEESTPLVGVPTPGANNRGRLRLSATGTPENVDTINITATQGGVVSRDGAKFTWSATDSAGNTRGEFGFDAPTAITYTESVYWETSGASEPYYDRPQIVSLSDGRLMIVAILRTSSTDTSVQVRFRSVAGVWGGWLELDDFTADYVYRSPTLLQRPDGTIEVYALYYEDTGFYHQVKKWTAPSDADSASDFDLESEACLVNPHDGAGADEIIRISVAYGAGQWLIVGDVNTTLQTWASRDGVAFEEATDTSSAIADRARPDAVWAGGYFHVVSKDSDTGAGTHYVQYLRIGDAFADVSDLTETNITNLTSIGTASVAIAVAEDGTLAALDRRSVDEWGVIFSKDYGQSWTEQSQLAVDFDGVECWEYGDLVFHRGQLCFLHNHDDDPANDNSIWLTLLGGYSNVTMPKQDNRRNDRLLDQVPWNRGSWIPVADLDGTGSWSKTGSAVITTADGAMNIDGVAASSAIFSANVVGSVESLIRVGLTVSGGQAYIHCRSGSYRVRVEIDIDTSTIRLYDVGAAAVVGSSDAYAGEDLDILIACSSGASASAWYRERTAGNHGEREWTLLASSSSLTADTTGVEFIVQGLAGTSTMADVDVYEAHIGTYKVRRLAGETSADLSGRAFSASATYVTDGTSIQAVGRAAGADTWEIANTYEYAFDNALPTVEPSPRTGWRSTSTDQQVIVLRHSDEDDAARYWSAGLWGLYLDAHNIGDIKVELDAGDGFGYFEVATLKCSLGGVTWDYAQPTNDSLTIRPDNSGSQERGWLRRNELVGGWVYSAANDDTAAITQNTAGGWAEGDNPTKSPPPVITVDDSTILDTSADSVRIFPTRNLFLLYFEDVSWSPQWASWRITVRPSASDPEPPDGYHEIGTLALGPVETLGWRWDQTRARVLELGTVIEEGSDGQTYRRRIKPDTERVEVAWTRPSPGFHEFTPSLDYVAAAGTLDKIPLAERWVGPERMLGILHEFDRRPIVLVPSIESYSGKSASSFRAYSRRWHSGMLCRFVPDSYRLETVKGDPGEGEYVRTSVVTVREVT